MPDNRNDAIRVKSLTKRFGNFTAVNAVSFNVKDGEIFGLLGPNGAGKTTTISILSTIIDKTSGSAELYGKDVSSQKDDVRKMIGIVFQDPSLDDELTGRENLDFHGRLYGVQEPDREKKIDAVLKLVELTDKAKNQVKTYSGGMKRRLEIARGFIHNPKVLFLDEPTIGLDPQTRRKLWDYIKQLNEREKLTIILTTHYMEEADALCNRIAIIDHGKIIKLDTPERLKDSLGGDIIRIGADKKSELFKALKAQKKKGGYVKAVKEHDKFIEVTSKNGGEAIPRIIDLAKSLRIKVEYATVKRPTLEDVFISLTGKEIRDEEGEGMSMMTKARFGQGGRR